jgi:Ca2+/Na+ antiporter
VVHSFPFEWVLVFVLGTSIPLLVWVSIFAFAYMRSRDGKLDVRVNIMAILGAFLALVSFFTGWAVVRGGNDWGIGNSLSFFLLFTYPLAVITPLAGIGQAGMLMWALSEAREQGASIVPYFGYVIGWVSVILMLASIAWPVGFPRGRPASAVYDRLLTMTVRRPSRPWMSTERTALFFFTSVFVAIWASYIVLHRQTRGVGPLFLIVGLVFVWYMLLRESHAEAWLKRLRIRKNEKERGNGQSIRVGHTAWIASVTMAYVSAVLSVYTYVGVFVTNDFGHGGEPATRVLVQGVIAFAAGVFAVIAHRRATAPALPSNLTVASVTLFASFMVLASFQSAFMVVSLGVSVRTCLIFAGMGLVGPAYFYLETRSGMG